MRALPLIAFLLLGAWLHAALLGQRVLTLPPLPDSLNYPAPRYTALVDSLANLLSASLPRETTPQEYLLAFAAVTKPMQGAGTRPDILALDLRAHALDCTSLAILLRDVTARVRADSLCFVVRARHVFATDGVWDYDPLARTCAPAAPRVPTAMEVVGGDDLMLSLSARAMGEWVDVQHYPQAVEWFLLAQSFAECDPLVAPAWGEAARHAGQLVEAEEHLRRLVAAWPDAAQTNYALARFLLLQGNVEEGLYYAQIALGLARMEGNARIEHAAGRMLQGKF